MMFGGGVGRFRSGPVSSSLLNTRLNSLLNKFLLFLGLSNDKVEKLCHYNPSRAVIIEELQEKGDFCADYVF